MRMRKKKNLIPRMERCSAWLIEDPAEYKGCWAEKMSGGRPVYLEIGCGKGRFINETAKQDPDSFFLAIEREKGALVVAMEHAFADNTQNVRFLDMDAASLLDVFAPHEIAGIYLNFSDPWPPKKQAKRRLTHKSFLDLYRVIMKPDSIIAFKTDNQKLFEFSLEEFCREGFLLQNLSLDLHATDTPNIETEYEQKFSEMGMRIYRVEAYLPPPPDET